MTLHKTFGPTTDILADLVKLNENFTDLDDSPVTTGNWTPTLYGTTVAGAPTYVVQTGNYLKIGDLVFVEARIEISDKDVIAGNIRIGGLPETVGANPVGGISIGLIYNFDIGAGYTAVTGTFLAADTAIGLYRYGTAADSATITDALITATFQIRFSGTYLAA